MIYPIKGLWVLAEVENHSNYLFTSEPQLLKDNQSQILIFFTQKEAWEYLQNNGIHGYVPIKHAEQELSKKEILEVARAKLLEEMDKQFNR